MNDKSIFISRQLTLDHLWDNLSEEGFTIHAESLIDFKPISFDKIPSADILYFYSRTAVQHFHAQAELQKINYQKYIIAAQGTRTAQAIKDILAVQVQYVFTQEDGLEKFSALCKEKKVLFIQAKHSLRTIQNVLVDLWYEELEVYNNTAKTKFEIPVSKYLLFTSPLNVKTYFSKYTLQEGQIIIAIGTTTQKACLEHSDKKNIHVTENSSELSLYEKLHELVT